MEHVYIIAEAGVNHNGSVETAKQLIDAAAAAGADAIKFQTFQTEQLVDRTAPKAEYQRINDAVPETQFDLLKRLELDHHSFQILFDYAKDKKIEFLSSPFDIESLEFLIRLGLHTIKIPSGEITNYPLLRNIGRSKKNVILSTGMSSMEEIADAMRILKKFGSTDITLMHCNTMYPTPYKDVNLKAMMLLNETFGTVVGYSDHTQGIEVSIAAAALGAKVIEKHFTLDRDMEGPDHRASLDPPMFQEMVRSIRNIEMALGNKEKKPTASEMPNMNVVRKSLFAKKTIIKGELFSEENLVTKRPATGISPMEWENIIGTASPRNFEKDELIVL